MGQNWRCGMNCRGVVRHLIAEDFEGAWEKTEDHRSCFCVHVPCCPKGSERSLVEWLDDIEGTFSPTCKWASCVLLPSADTLAHFDWSRVESEGGTAIRTLSRTLIDKVRARFVEITNNPKVKKYNKTILIVGHDYSHNFIGATKNPCFRWDKDGSCKANISHLHILAPKVQSKRG